MKCLKLEYADAFLLGPAEKILKIPFSGFMMSRRWRYLQTAAGNQVVVLEPGKYPIATNDTYMWPVLPLVKYRGGYFTATARKAFEYGWPVMNTAAECVRLMMGAIPRTRHRVFWVDRNIGVVVVDVIKRPKPEQPVARKYIPVRGDPHLEVAQLLFGKACPKCGSKELKPRWGDGNGPTCGYLGLCRWVKEPLCFNHIHVTCQVCHYEWLEEPLDAAETA